MLQSTNIEYIYALLTTALFYGFWGQAFHDYRNTVPHSGYSIVDGWRRDKMQKSAAVQMRKRIEAKLACKEEARGEESPSFSEEPPYCTPFRDLPIADMAGSFYCFTSNCDAHFYDFFPAQDIHDCHGNIELWQCSSRDCDSGIWRAPADWGIVVDPQTSEALPTAIDHYFSVEHESRVHDTPRIGHSFGLGTRNNLLQFMPPSISEVGWDMKHLADTAHESPNWPKCEHCNSPARPAIFMFGDFGWKYDHAQDARWNAWRESLIDLCSESSTNLKVCILEVGCGKNVATCRAVSEGLLEELIDTGFGDNACLVRINPDFHEADDERLADYVIGIRSRGLTALNLIEGVRKAK